MKEIKYCEILGCGRSVNSKGLCTLHYRRTVKGTDINSPIKINLVNLGKTCKIPRCDLDAKVKGLCRNHYNQQLRGIDTNKPSQQEFRGYELVGDICQIPVGIDNYHYATVDKEFLHLAIMYKWHLSNGYAFGVVDGHHVRLHHMIVGRPDKPFVVDHIDGNKLNNCKSNLRITTQHINGLNCKLSKNNTSGFNGIYFAKRKKKWVARIKLNYKNKYLGIFENPLDAGRCYQEYKDSYFKERNLEISSNTRI